MATAFHERYPSVVANLNFLDQFIGASPGGVLALDRQNTCVFWGASCEQVSGLGAPDVLGHSVKDVFPFSVSNGELEQIRNALAGKPGHSRAKPWSIQASGRSGFYDAFFYPLRDSGHEVIGVAIAAFEISERVQTELRLKETESRFRAMADSSPVMLWMENPDRKANFFNQTWLAFTGRSLEQEWGKGWLESIHRDDLERCCHFWDQHFNERKPYELEYRMQRHDGEYRWIMERGSPRYSQSGEFAGFIGSAVDITDHKLALEEYRMAKIAADDANRAKSAFLSMISHEIRTPLGIVLGFSELALTPGHSPAELKQYFETIQRNGQLVVSIINGILDLSKIEAGKLEVESSEVRLQELIEEVTSILSLKADAKAIALKITHGFEPFLTIETDPIRLKQVLVNVIGNAIKFTDQGRVTVDVRLEGGKLAFVVEDTGPGMTAEQAARIFEPFMQGDNTTSRRFGGTGLGLSLARRLANALGGDVKLVRTAPGGGSVFAITVDAGRVRNRGDHQLTPVSRPQLKNLRGRRVLLVDDTPENQILIGRYLKSAGVEVDCASNGREGVACALADSYDVVLMDIGMPEMDGFEATRALRENGYSTPIIALTAYALKEERERCLASGFSEHISKPVSKDELLVTLAGLIEGAGPSAADESDPLAASCLKDSYHVPAMLR